MIVLLLFNNLISQKGKLVLQQEHALSLLQNLVAIIANCCGGFRLQTSPKEKAPNRALLALDCRMKRLCDQS